MRVITTENKHNLHAKHVIAPNYIFFGPELVSKTNVSGLFKRKVGIKYYPEYSNS